MEEIYLVHQDALHSLLALQDAADAIDTEDFTTEAFENVIASFNESASLFTAFLVLYLEQVYDIHLASEEPAHVLSQAAQAKIITSKEHKQLAHYIVDESALYVPQDEFDAERMLDELDILHDSMRDILDDAEW